MIIVERLAGLASGGVFLSRLLTCRSHRSTTQGHNQARGKTNGSEPERRRGLGQRDTIRDRPGGGRESLPPSICAGRARFGGARAAHETAIPGGNFRSVEGEQSVRLSSAQQLPSGEPEPRSGNNDPWERTGRPGVGKTSIRDN